tara:strand:+ start:1212 stop:1793 length:582 start_codon:yes stop_codon:yes gene_type:complete
MSLLKNIITESGSVAIWEIKETLKELITLSDDLYTTDFKNKNRKKEWIATRLLLNELKPNHKIYYNKFGAPDLLNNEFISISHSKELIAISLSRKKTGVDIQKISKKTVILSSKFVSQQNNENLSEDKATLIWCCKEAVFKWHQKGNINFIKDIKIEPFEAMEEGSIIAKFCGTKLILHYKKILNHYLVYLCK